MWTLIREPFPLSGRQNMARDEALFQAVSAGESPPTLRLYGWQPAAVSLGYHQEIAAAVDQEACRQLGIDIVRRPTGGKAVFHHREVTYAVVARITEPPFHGSLAQSYRALTCVFIDMCRSMGIEPDGDMLVQTGTSHPRRGNPFCFHAATRYEVTVGGRKVIGNAQKRSRRTFLQHGSIPMQTDLTLLRKIIPAAVSSIDSQPFTDLSTLLGRIPAVEEVQSILIAAFERALTVAIQPRGYTREEIQYIDQLLADEREGGGGKSRQPGYSSAG